MTVEDHKELASWLGKKQWEYTQNGCDGSSARRKAIEEACGFFNHPVMPDQLETTMAKLRARIRKGKQESDENQDNPVMTELYRAWAEKNDLVPDDRILAHFTQKTAGCFYNARRMCIDAGFVFERDKDVGWRVTARPQPERTYTEAEMQEIIKQLLKQFGK
jgi:hypothetical protein